MTVGNLECFDVIARRDYFRIAHSRKERNVSVVIAVRVCDEDSVWPR